MTVDAKGRDVVEPCYVTIYIQSAHTLSPITSKPDVIQVQIQQACMSFTSLNSTLY